MDITVQAIVKLSGEEAKTDLLNAHKTAMNVLESGKLDARVDYRARNEGEEFAPFPDDGAIRVVVEHTYEPDDEDDDFTQKDAIRQHADCLQMDDEWYAEVYVGSKMVCGLDGDFGSAKKTVVDPDTFSEFEKYAPVSEARKGNDGMTP